MKKKKKTIHMMTLHSFWHVAKLLQCNQSSELPAISSLDLHTSAQLRAAVRQTVHQEVAAGTHLIKLLNVISNSSCVCLTTLWSFESVVLVTDLKQIP